MTRLLIALAINALGIAVTPAANAGCDDYCEEYLEEAYERAYAREEAAEYADDEDEIYVRRPGKTQRPGRRAAPARSRASATAGPGSATWKRAPSPKADQSGASGDKNAVADVGGCKQYFAAIGMTLSVPCK